MKKLPFAIVAIAALALSGCASSSGEIGSLSKARVASRAAFTARWCGTLAASSAACRAGNTVTNPSGGSATYALDSSAAMSLNFSDWVVTDSSGSYTVNGSLLLSNCSRSTGSSDEVIVGYDISGTLSLTCGTVTASDVGIALSSTYTFTRNGYTNGTTNVTTYIDSGKASLTGSVDGGETFSTGYTFSLTEGAEI